jgi:hypothetical protein
MKTKVLLICTLLIGMLMSACAASAVPTADMTPVASSTESGIGTEDVGHYPLSTRTGVADIDIVLAAVESGDTQQLRDMLRFMNVACTHAEGLGGPPKCLDGENEGTIVSVFPFLGSEGSFLHLENLDVWTGIDVTHLYAVYGNSESVYSDENFPSGEFAVLFLSEDHFPATVMQITNGQIVRIDTVFDTSADGLENVLNRDASALILSPR